MVRWFLEERVIWQPVRHPLCISYRLLEVRIFLRDFLDFSFWILGILVGYHRTHLAFVINFIWYTAPPLHLTQTDIETHTLRPTHSGPHTKENH